MDLSNPLWMFLITFLTLIVTGVGIIISIAIFLKQRSRKELMYDYEGTPLVTIRDQVKNKIRVMYNFTPINDAYFLLLKVWNSGNVAILPADYLDPIRFTFGERAEILSYDVIETEPKNIKKKVSIVVGGNDLKINPLLLNKGSMIVIKMVLSNFEGEISPDVYISGLDPIRKADSSSVYRLNSKLSLSFYPQVFFIGPLLIISNAILALLNPQNIHTGAIFSMILSATTIFMGIFMFLERRLWYLSRYKINQLISTEE